MMHSEPTKDLRNRFEQKKRAKKSKSVELAELNPDISSKKELKPLLDPSPALPSQADQPSSKVDVSNFHSELHRLAEQAVQVIFPFNRLSIILDGAEKLSLALAAKWFWSWRGINAEEDRVAIQQFVLTFKNVFDEKSSGLKITTREDKSLSSVESTEADKICKANGFFKLLLQKIYLAPDLGDLLIPHIPYIQTFMYMAIVQLTERVVELNMQKSILTEKPINDAKPPLSLSDPKSAKSAPPIAGTILTQGITDEKKMASEMLGLPKSEPDLATQQIQEIIFNRTKLNVIKEAAAEFYPQINNKYYFWFRGIGKHAEENRRNICNKTQEFIGYFSSNQINAHRSNVDKQKLLIKTNQVLANLIQQIYIAPDLGDLYLCHFSALQPFMRIYMEQLMARCVALNIKINQIKQKKAEAQEESHNFESQRLPSGMSR